jgi:YggT family protein
MAPLQEIGTLILQTLGSLYLLVVVLRFLLQLARADFYNPMSQFIVKVTNPPLLPLRRVIPGVMGVDFAAVVLALLVQFVIIELGALILLGGLINPLYALLWSAIGLLALTANIYFWALLIMVIASWVAPQSANPALRLVHQLVEPVMAPFRKIMPDLGGIDISPIFAFLALNVVQVLIKYLAAYAGMGGVAQQLVLGL